jgi:alpha-glucosidase (family GH31 glycosyl hydrolase)
MGRVLAAALAALVLSAPVAAAAERVVDAGELRAVAATDPWHLTFTDASGATVLDGVALTYVRAGTEHGATRVLSEREAGGAYEAELATTDPLGSISVRIVPDASGVVAVAANAPAGATRMRMSFAARDGERYLGFGERSNAVDQRGNTIENYVADGPYQPEEYAAIAAFVPAPGVRPRDDSTYFPIPWLLSTAGYGVLLDNDDRSEFDLTSPSEWSVSVDAAELRLRVFAGPTPAAVLERFTARLGRQPPAAAPWYFGPWYQPKGRDEENLEVFGRGDVPVSVAQTYTHYLPCADQTGRTDAERERVARLHAAGLAVTTYFNPMICTNHPRYAEARPHLTKNALGQPYEYRYTGSEQFLVAQFDFSSPSARDFYGGLLAEAVGDGHDGWMEDFGEYTPTDAQSSDGTPGPRMHNRYPVLYHQAAHDFSRRAAKPLARFNRSGWTGAAQHSQIVWGGDPTTDWGFDGLASAVTQGLTIGLSGVSIWGSDIGGFFALSAPETTSELLIRWIQLGAVSGVMRTQANGFAIPGKARRAQIFDPDVLPVWRRYAKLRTQLYPYIAAAERAYDRTGLPLMRHLALVHPDDAAAAARDDEFLFGPDLLAAPVLEPGATERSVYLPAGRWVDLWRSARMTDYGALRQRRAHVIRGGRDVIIPAPLDRLPLLVRAGAVLPLLPHDVDTLTEYGDEEGLVHLSDRRRRMRLLAWPRGRSRAAIGEGESVRSRQTRRGWLLAVRGRIARRYSLEASLATLRRPFRPCAVRVGGRRLRRSAWSYGRRSQVLRATFRARSARVVVRRRCAT